MKRSLIRLILALLPLGAWVEVAAQTTSVSSPTGGIQMGGAAVTQGTATFIPKDGYGHPIAVTIPGGGINLPGNVAKPLGYSCAITNGGMSACNVPDETATAPSGFCYDITVADTSTGRASSGMSYRLACVPGITGTAFRLDQYSPLSTVPTVAAMTHTSGSGVPTLGCTEPAEYFDKVNRTLYECSSGAWVQVGGTGGSTFTGGAVANATTFQSTVTLAADPTLALQAATKQYVDNHAGGLPGQIFYAQAGDTISSIESACSSLCTYIVTVPQTITLAADHTLNANVQLDFRAGGKWTVNGAFTLTIPGNVTGTLDAHFAGTSTVKFGQSQALVPVEWFGGIGYSTIATAVSSGTDNASAFNKCVASLAAGQCLIQAKAYPVASAIPITASSVGIRGTAQGYEYAAAPSGSASIIVSTSASADIVSVTGADASHKLLWNGFQDFSLHRSVLPTGTAKGLALNHTCGVRVERVQSNDSVSPFYAHDAPSCSVGGFFSTQASWGYSVVPLSSYTTGTYYGYNLDSEDGQSEATIILNNAGFGLPSVMPGGVSKGVAIHGSAINDVNGYQVGGAQTNVGIDIVYDGTGVEGSGGDLHFVQSIIDTSVQAAVKITNVPLSAGLLGIDFDGGLLAATNKAIEVQGTTIPVFFRGVQMFSQGSSSGLVLVNGSSNFHLFESILAGGNPSTPSYFVNLNNSTNNSIRGNHFVGRSGFAPTSLLTLTNGSTLNSIGGNVYGGYATNAVTLDGTSQTNTVGPEQVDAAHITTAYNGFTSQSTGFPGAITCNGGSCASGGGGSSYPEVTSTVSGANGANAAGLSILGDANAHLPTNLMSVIGQQSLYCLNCHYNGSAWIRDADGSVAAIRTMTNATAGGMFQVSLPGGGVAGSSIPNMDSTDVGFFCMRNYTGGGTAAGSGFRCWINGQTVDPSDAAWPANAALVLNPDKSFSVDSSGNTTVAGGGNTLYRCTTAGALPVGALTTSTGNCGASSDTGLRVH